MSGLLRPLPARGLHPNALHKLFASGTKNGFPTMIRTKTCLVVGLLGMALLFTGCGAAGTRLGRSLDMPPLLSGSDSKYDRRGLAEAVEKDPFPKATQSARVANAKVEVQQ